MEKGEWTKANTQELITAFESHPCLYDSKHKLYKNKHARAHSLQEILDHLNFCGMNLSTTEVRRRKKIANLRSQYNHELTKIKDSCRSGTSSDDIYEPSVWWFDALSFLKPYIQPRNWKNSYINSESLSQQGEFRNQDTIDIEDNSSAESSVMEGKECKASTTKKRKTMQQQQNGEDAIMANTLQALTGFQNELNRRNSDGRNEQFGKYVVSELNEINVLELLTDCKNEINNILYKYKKAYIKNINNVMEFELQ